MENNDEALLLKTPIFDVVQTKEVDVGFKPVRVNSNDWVTIIVEKNNQYLMEKQFRFGKWNNVNEFPCGIVEDGEFPKTAAARELKEETGYEVNEMDLLYLGSYAVNPAFMSNDMHYFYINLDQMPFQKGDTRLDEHEKISVYWENKDKVIDMIDGKIHGDIPIPALAGCAMWAMKRRNLI